jgi:hypothetical protein
MNEKLAELTAAAEQIVESVNALNKDAGGQLISLAVTAKRNRLMIWGLAISLLLDVLLTGFVVSLTFRVNETQQVTRSQVLCPLYQQFVNADTPKARELARRNGQDLEARDKAFRVIRESYDVLDCEGEEGLQP